MKVMLNVPFADKDEAKRLGCRFSSAAKRWYIEDPEDMQPFMRWMPEHLKRPHKITAAVNAKK